MSDQHKIQHTLDSLTAQLEAGIQKIDLGPIQAEMDEIEQKMASLHAAIAKLDNK